MLENKRIKERYSEDKPGEYTIWSSSDLLSPDEKYALVKVKTDEDGNLYPEALSDSAIDQEAYKIAKNSLANSAKTGKTLEQTLLRLDKTLNHSDPFFSVEVDRNISNTGYELLAAQTLITLRDDIKAVYNRKFTDTKDYTAAEQAEDAILDKYQELTGLQYYNDKIVDADQYAHLLYLLRKKDYEEPKDNIYIKELKKLVSDLIDKAKVKYSK